MLEKISIPAKVFYVYPQYNNDIIILLELNFVRNATSVIPYDIVFNYQEGETNIR
jgi:hypothetical protein